MEPLPARRRWQAITVATLVLVPAFWAMLAGFVAAASDDAGGPHAGAALALGVALVPFTFIVLAFMSGQPNPPAAVLRAMGLALVVGIPVAAVTIDAVTGMVAGIGAGGVAALRADHVHRTMPRAVAVTAAAVYVFVLVRTAGALALLAAPALPLTGIGLADHWSERQHERELAGVEP